MKPIRLSSVHTLATIVSPCLLLALGGCFGKHPGPWRAANPEDFEVLRAHYKVETESREVLRRDVSVWFIGPASGYPEWAFRNGDGTIEIVKEPRP
jgi:hypothetical protein